jgi:hypothetical protein
MLVSVVQYLWSILKAIYVILQYFVKSVILRVPVSYPGDPIPNKLTRVGQWPKKKTEMGPGWLFSCDYKSHEVSMKATGVPLTGESAGRQIWHKKKEASGTFFASPSSPKSRAKKAFFSADMSFSAAENPNSGDKVFRNLMISAWQGEVPDEAFAPETARDAAAKGLGFYQMLQCEDGHWAGDYGGPMFLMPGLVICMYVSKIPFAPERRDGMVLTPTYAVSVLVGVTVFVS